MNYQNHLMSTENGTFRIQKKRTGNQISFSQAQYSLKISL